MRLWLLSMLPTFALLLLLPAQPAPTTQPTSEPAYRWTLPIELRVAYPSGWTETRIGQSREHVVAVCDAHLTDIAWTQVKVRTAYAFGDTSGGSRKWGEYALAHQSTKPLVVYLVRSLPAGACWVPAYAMGDPVAVASEPYNPMALACAIDQAVQVTGERWWGAVWSITDPRAEYAESIRRFTEVRPIEAWVCRWQWGMEVRR